MNLSRVTYTKPMRLLKKYTLRIHADNTYPDEPEETVYLCGLGRIEDGPTGVSIFPMCYDNGLYFNRTQSVEMCKRLFHKINMECPPYPISSHRIYKYGTIWDAEYATDRISCRVHISISRREIHMYRVENHITTQVITVPRDSGFLEWTMPTDTHQ